MEENPQTFRKRFFIGANTKDGFINFAPSLIQKADRVYIIKGGPGTGKSTLMSRYAAWAEEIGETVTYYHCSSDPSSLDGVYLEHLKIFVTDGTSPHTAEAKYPSAGETLLDVGRGLDGGRLRPCLNEIKRLTEKKATAYRRAYRFMAAEALFREERAGAAASATLEGKLKAAAKRFVSRLGAGSGFTQDVRQTVSTGMEGEITLPTLQTLAREAFWVTESDGVGEVFLLSVMDAAEKAKQPVWVSYNRFLQPSTLYFPEKAVFLSAELPEALGSRDKIIRADRFIDREKKALRRSDLRLFKKQAEEIRQHTLALFREIRAAHFGLEAIYRDAMDFSVRDELLEKLKKETLSPSAGDRFPMERIPVIL